MTVEEECSETTYYGTKFLILRTIPIGLPLCFYSITLFMNYSVVQSLIYQKVCEQYSNSLDAGINCSHYEKISVNPQLQKEANWILLLSSVALCVIGVFASAIIGRLGDAKSRKVALCIPFFGLLLVDVSLVVQSFYMKLSVYWLIGSEALFAAFGGYMSILSSSFAYASDSVHNCPIRCRSQIIAILEGIIGLGGTIGYGCSFLLRIVGFSSLFTAFLMIHMICFLLTCLLPSSSRRNASTQKLENDLFGLQLIKSVRQAKQMGAFLAMSTAFSVSFFAFMGSTHILFYYLKFRFSWDAGLYGFVKGPSHGLSAFNTLFVYPFLRSRNFTDRTLALIGLISRAFGFLWLAVTWSTASTFLLVLSNSFSRFAATGMRSIMANSLPSEIHGSMFALFAVIEAICNLLAATVFHTVFPLSLNFLPQISFYILAALMLIPIAILWSRHEPQETAEFLTT